MLLNFTYWSHNGDTTLVKLCSSAPKPKAGARQRTTRDSLLGSVCGLGFFSVAFENFTNLGEYDFREFRPY